MKTSGKRVSVSQRGFVTAQSNHTTIRKSWKSLAAVGFGLLLSVPGLTQAQYTFTTFDVPKATATATAVNGNSTNAIAGQFDDAKGTHGFVLRNRVFATIDDLKAVGGTIINGINAPGQLAGTYNVAPDTTPHAFFDNNGSFTTLDPPGSIRSQGGFINSRGQVVGTYRDAQEKRHGFIWSNGVFITTSINVPNDDPVLGTVAFGINDIGAVVGDYVDANGKRRGFLRSSNGVFTTFDVPGAVLTIAEGINNVGTIVGWYIDDKGIHGFVLKNSIFTYPVDAPNSSGDTEINSINANGQIVGLYFDADGVEHGFIGTPAN